MDQAIVSPWVIYFMYVSAALKGACEVCAILALVALIMCMCTFLFATDDEIVAKAKTITRPLIIITFLLWMLFIFVPYKKTIIEMIVAKHITYENVGKVTTELKKIEEALLKYLDK